MSLKLVFKDYPQRSIVLASDSHALVFHHSASPNDDAITSSLSPTPDRNGLPSRSASRSMVEFTSRRAIELKDYKAFTSLPCLGCLGLVCVNGDTFLCVVTSARPVATVRPGETVSRIHGVEFHCLNRSDFDGFETEVNAYPIDSDGFDQGRSQQPLGVEHPCLALRKLLSGGTFYFSGDFDLTNRLQDRPLNENSFDIDAFDSSFLWNSHMIGPLLGFRSRLSQNDRANLDDSRILTCAIRGFVESLPIPRPATRMEGRSRSAGLPAALTLISRLSCRRAGTRFNSRGIDDDGNVANFVETETVVWDPGAGPDSHVIGFSFCQVRGSVPIFWEQQTGLLPNQQKIQITRSPEATQPAFDRHMEGLVTKYGAAHVVNLLSETKTGEVELSMRYRYHIQKSPLAIEGQDHNRNTHGRLLKCTEYDFHAETKGPAGYEAASLIRHHLEESADGFGYFLVESARQAQVEPSTGSRERERSLVTVLQQEGAFRTNCLDCLDRTNLVQGIISRMAIESFLNANCSNASPDFWMRHSTLWADNGDALSKIYAGTGALKSSFTRTGKMSLAGAIADARKSATRMYINNFADKDRQNTIDVLLGRLVGQEPVHLHDPVNDYVANELARRAAEYTSDKSIRIHVGTFNLNGRLDGINKDLSDWLNPPSLVRENQLPEIVVVGFQEIVELSPQQIMSTDPSRRQQWEKAVLRCLNGATETLHSDDYILLRGGQLVGAALLIFVRSSVIAEVKNVEGSLKKTGMSGIAGNKGAVAVRMDFANTRLCFVTAHLAAGFSNVEERNRDYATISDGLRFQRGRKIDDHDTVIWLGDFNYRINLPDDKARGLIDVQDLETLYENDQLNLQMVEGLTFPYYTEARLSFNPTYKYDIGTDRYDTSEKARVPAWCDRILWKGKNLKQLSYDCAPLRFSDHRPVYATFRCSVRVVNEAVKESLGQELYAQRKGSMKVSTAMPSNSSDEEENLLDFEPIAPGLPPPSSDKGKWWLDHGMSARSTISTPAQEQSLNKQRTSNPFVSPDAPDWVTSGTVNSACGSLQVNIDPSKNGPRNLPPPFNPVHAPLGPADTLGPGCFSSTPASLSKNPRPPVPKKPLGLSNDVQTMERPQQSFAGHDMVNGARTAGETILPPLSRHVSTVPTSMNVSNVTNLERPPLPPRTNMMDADEELDNMVAWVPLKPS